MKKLDCNGFCGNWPFRRFYHGGLDGLREVHRKSGISGGWVSALESVFYNDPMEAEEQLAEALSGTEYRQIAGVSPTLPAAAGAVREAVSHWNIAGVRVYPGYHGFRLDGPEMRDLCALLEELGLPLLVTVRLEDERLNYLMTPRSVTGEELDALPARCPGLKILYTGMQTYEVTALAETFRACGNLYAETSFFKSPCTPFEDVLATVPVSRILYGSGYPLCSVMSTSVALDHAAIPEEDRDAVYWKNAEAFFGQGPQRAVR